MIHSNSSFRTAEDVYLQEFLNAVRPSYVLPSRWMLSHTLLDAEAARIQAETIQNIQNRQSLTLLIDGWEDLLRRSVYGTVLAGVGEYPIILSLDDISGQRGSAEKLLQLAEHSLQKMEVDPRSVLGLTTDDPSVMRAFRRLFTKKYPWVVVRLFY